MKSKNIKVGEIYHFLTVLSVEGPNISCLCVCGKKKIIPAGSIGRIKSCGCYNRKLASDRASKLKKKYSNEITKHPLYNIFKRIKIRCYTKNNKYYLGGHIKICDAWRNNYEAFYDWAIKTWFADALLTRIDDGGDFSPDNCIFLHKNSVKQKRTVGKYTPMSEETKNKIKSTNLKKYGYEYPLQSKLIREKCNKTLYEKHGVQNASSVPGALEKSKKTCIEKYGVDHHMKTEEYKLKFKKKTIDNGQAYIYNGRMSDELANYIGVSRSCMNARIRKYGFELALSMDKKQSEIERIIESILEKNNISFIKQFRIENRIADFLIEDKKLIIEADGLYWHSDAVNKNKFYHRDKKILYDKYGYKSLFFRENEIEKQSTIIESIILNKVNLSKVFYARKCILLEVSKEDAKKFYNENHLMGNGKGISFGLFYENTPLAMMQITNKKEYCEVSRFCTAYNTSIIGGFSKLLSAAIKHFNPKQFITFIDRRYGDGYYLNKLGFNLVNNYISFKWTKNEKAIHRMKFPGNTGYDNGWYKIWDCGQAKYVMIL